MRNKYAHKSGLSSIAATAALSAIVLLSVLAWRTNAILSAKDNALYAVSDYPSSAGVRINAGFTLGTPEEGATATSASAEDPNDLSLIGTDALGRVIGTYVGLKQSGAYTPEAGERAAESVASSFDAQISYALFPESGIKTDDDISYKRMLLYRSDMRAALLPLLKNTEPEFAVFARYAATGDKSNLANLEKIAERYKTAALNAEGVIVPKDAVGYHADAINSLILFSATLLQMVKYADDPMASLALLRAYNDAELDVFTSFNALASYQKNKAL